VHSSLNNVHKRSMFRNRLSEERPSVVAVRKPFSADDRWRNHTCVLARAGECQTTHYGTFMSAMVSQLASITEEATMLL
jgi:hypothetical protein